MSFLTILDDEQTFEYSPTEPETGQRMETVFILRVLPDAVLKEIRRANTRTVFERHERVEKQDDFAIGRAIVDYALVDWRGVKSARSEEEIPCTAEMKVKLPETVKGDIVRLCAGKEAGAELSKAGQEKKPLKPTLRASKAS